MEFRIADTFTASLAKLTADEQKAAKITAVDMQMDPSNPGLKLHRVDKSKDKDFWSVRVSGDLRIIVHKTAASFLLCYVDHHDKAYDWAERRKIERHPKTGAAQLVEIRERVREVVVPVYVEGPAPEAPPKPPLFADESREDLLSWGVPEEWLDDVRAATENTLHLVAEHLPQEAAEALLETAVGNRPKAPVIGSTTDSDDAGFAHPDAQRRFRVMTNVDELQAALDAPWETWAVFLHPAQREIVEKDHAGPARVSGSAGTGKTIVALHRAVHLARLEEEPRVVLVTFSETLAAALARRLKLLIGNQPRLAERLEVCSMEGLASRLYAASFGKPKIASPERVREALAAASAGAGELNVSQRFLEVEWNQVVDAWQLHTWEEYRDVKRLGRRTRLSEAKREQFWGIFEAVRQDLAADGLMTRAEVFGILTAHLAKTETSPFAHAVADEAQDISVAELRFLAALGGGRPNSLFFAGDLGQRIFHQPFSWLSLGVDVRGRSRTLRVNYRTSHQIRQHADRLLGTELSDVDGVSEDRRGTISVFDGPAPDIQLLASEEDERTVVATWIAERMQAGFDAREIAVFVRSEAEIPRARAAAEEAGAEAQVLGDKMQSRKGAVVVSTMHRAKGLEYRAVVVMACDDEILPSQVRIESVGDDAELDEVYQTERHLLYVACTRARDRLLVTGVAPGSEFLEDMEG